MKSVVVVFMVSIGAFEQDARRSPATKVVNNGRSFMVDRRLEMDGVFMERRIGRDPLEVEDQTGGEAVLEIFRRCERESVAEADVEVGNQAVADADQAFRVEISFIRAVERGGAGDFEVEMDQSGVGHMFVAAIVAVAGVVFTKGFHEGESVYQLGLVGIKAVFDADLGVQGEPVAKV